MWKCKYCGDTTFKAIVGNIDIEETGEVIIPDNRVVYKFECSRCRKAKDDIEELAYWIENEE